MKVDVGGSCASAALPDAKGAAARVAAVCCGTVRELKLKWVMLLCLLLPKGA